jgi:hypothetical protein
MYSRSVDMVMSDTSQAWDCRRHAAREPVVLAGSAYALARSRSVIVSDLSNEGAKLDGRDLPPPGEDLLMVVGSFESFAKVMWRTDEKAGVRFDEQVAPEAIEKMKKEAQWATVTGWWR